MSVHYMCEPLSKNRWLFRLFIEGIEVTDRHRNNGLLQVYPNRTELCRWRTKDGDSSMLKSIMLEWCPT